MPGRLTWNANPLLKQREVRSSPSWGVRFQLQRCRSPSSVSEQVKAMKRIQVPDKRLLFAATVPSILRWMEQLRDGSP